MTKYVLAALAAFAIGALVEQARGDEIAAADRWLAETEISAKREALGMCRSTHCRQQILERKIPVSVAHACLKSAHHMPSTDHNAVGLENMTLDCTEGLMRWNPDLVLYYRSLD